MEVRSEMRSIHRSMSLNCGVDHFRIRKTLESVMRMLDIRSKWLEILFSKFKVSGQCLGNMSIGVDFMTRCRLFFENVIFQKSENHVLEVPIKFSIVYLCEIHLVAFNGNNWKLKNELVY